MPQISRRPFLSGLALWMEPDRWICVVPDEGPLPATLHALGVRMVGEVRGQELDSWTLRANVPVVNSKSPELWGWMPFPKMMDLQKLLHAVPVDSLTGRVVHSYGKHQGPIEGALAEAFGFTEEARRVMRFGELERIFRAVEMQDQNTEVRQRLQEATSLLKCFGKESHGSVWFEGAISAPTLYFARNRAGYILAILGTEVSRSTSATRCTIL
ncbi:unnamed protein product [Cladocopium goreaui]|uniref:Uncharacterized protein n=1 Tax=Cladocopium goreaui TaxID=2562237 RepID=A0A9P1CKR1_9DINO|nr:unnamed protein product [Cladocopium goreaui]